MPARDATPIIVRLPNWVGDVIMALPALALLERAGFDLHLFGRGWVQDLLSGTPYRCYTLPKNFQAARQALAQCPAKKAVLFTNSFSSALQARASGKEVIGYRGDGRRFLLNQSSQKPAHAHETGVFYQLSALAIRRWGAQTEHVKHLASQPVPNRLQLPIAPEHQRSIWSKAPRIKGHTYWVICPFAVGTTKEGQPKIWPHWIELCKYLTAQNHSIIICPGPNEVQAAEPFEPYADILHNFTLAEYAQVLKGAHQVIANDSGPMHIAAAVNAPVLGIFGVSDPRRTHPWGGQYIGSATGWPTLAEVIDQLGIMKR